MLNGLLSKGRLVFQVKCTLFNNVPPQFGPCLMLKGGQLFSGGYGIIIIIITLYIQHSLKLAIAIPSYYIVVVG